MHISDNQYTHYLEFVIVIRYTDSENNAVKLFLQVVQDSEEEILDLVVVEIEEMIMAVEDGIEWVVPLVVGVVHLVVEAEVVLVDLVWDPPNL